MDTSEKLKGRILVIDDSEELLEVIKLILEREGYEVIVKTSPLGIADLVQKITIDLLFLDVILLGKNGRDICKELKSGASTSYFPIILISATPQLLANFSECHAHGIIEKPFDISQLIASVENALSKRA